MDEFESDPWISACESNRWRPRIEALTPASRPSMEAAVVQRALPVYLSWAESRDPDGAESARRGLQILWNSVHSLYDRAQAALAADYIQEHDPRDHHPPPGVWAAFESLRWGLWHVDSTGLSWESTCLDEGYSVVADVVCQPGRSLEENDAICRADPRVQAELAFQEAILSEIERTGEPITGSRAAQISAEINRRHLVTA